jgi:hypothetical protein
VVIGPAESLREFRCDVVAEGAVYGIRETVPFVLATWHAVSPRQALLWMRVQALRIANGLDPDPRSSPWARQVPGAVDSGSSDGPARLRIWADTVGRERAVRDQLRDGIPVTFTVTDGANGTFRLAIWPVAVRADPDPGLIPAGCPDLVEGIRR